MKKIIVIIMFLAMQIKTFSCPVCERQQPKMLRGIVHGGGAENNWDYVIVWTVAVIAALSLFFSIKWIIKPGEKNEEHIKYSIINQD